MSESMDTMIFHEDIIVESVSSTKRIEKGNIAPPIASSKQTEDITTKKDLKRILKSDVMRRRYEVLPGSSKIALIY